MQSNTDEVRAHAPVQGILDRLQARIGSQKYNTWFQHGARVTIEDGHVKVSVPNAFVAHWVEGHYLCEIADAADAETGQRRPVVVSVDPSLAQEVRRRDLDRQADLVSKVTEGRARGRSAPRTVPLRHTMADFVVGESNKLGYSAALTICSTERPVFNPLFVYGPCGVGKTHLLQGICHRFSQLRRDGELMRWRYVTAEQFTNEFVVSLRHKKIGEFRARYRDLDLLAIDDVHFLSAKKATQSEFLHTFNAIESVGKRVVMASDAHPRLVGDLNEQLVSRFVAGMVVKVDVPDASLRAELVARKAKQLNLDVPVGVLEYVARHIRGSVRELEGTLVKLSALAALESEPISVSMVSHALSDHLARTDSVLTLGDIEAVVAAYFGVTPADLHSSRRTKTVSAARMVAMYFGRRHTPMSFPEIGRHMGKNHSSVVLAVQRMEGLLESDSQVKWMSPAGGKAMDARKLIELLAEQFT